MGWDIQKLYANKTVEYLAADDIYYRNFVIQDIWDNLLKEQDEKELCWAVMNFISVLQNTEEQNELKNNLNLLMGEIFEYPLEAYENNEKALMDYIKGHSGIPCAFGDIEIDIKNNRLGQGGNGVVFSGVLGKYDVAVKFLINYSKKKLERFKAEYINVNIVRERLKHTVSYLNYETLNLGNEAIPFIVMKKYDVSLKKARLAVYFEVEKINTLKDGEFLLTILSSVAQQEVENTSAYVKKGLKMKMKRGELVGFQGCLGYDYDVVTKSLSINEEGAETVRYIFDRYVAGAGSTMIARELNEQGIPTIKGNPWTSSSVMGIINNEKYKGDILLGKTFTVDPISKRRLENLGEEDRFYIKNHHEPIISEEKFARAQEIRERRNGGRKKGVAPGKREKFSRQYAFSCMLECGFCGANLSRRRWHSSSKYTKTIWQCVESTKHGKRFCPDSKGIPEQVIEDAFIESYRMLCTDHKDVLEEFIKRVEKTLSEDSIEDKIEKLNRSVYNIQYKRKKLLENYLEGVVAKDIYEETDVGYEKKLSEAKTQLSMLEQQYDNEGSLQRRLADFRKALSKNQILEEFDRGIFESIIEKVIVGGYDENGEKDPYKIIFIYKTGFKNEIGNAKERFGKKSKAVETVKEMCSHIVDEVKDVCSYVSDNTVYCS